MENTIGIFLITASNKMLICHPTSASRQVWSIPKGLKEDYESDWSAGIRELYEETHIAFDRIKESVVHIVRMSDVKYKKRSKILTPYFIKLNTDSVIDFKLSCDSTFLTITGELIPEVDAFKWVDISEALKYLHETQIKALEEYLDKWN